LARAHVDEARAVAESFAIAEDHPQIRARPHAHVRHQLLYASRGVLTLLTDAGSWLLPSERCAFLPAGMVHRVRADAEVSLRTIYLSPKLEGVPCSFSVFVLPPLGRELVAFAMQYEAHVPLDGCGRDTFSLLARLAGTWASTPCPFELPAGGVSRGASCHADPPRRYRVRGLGVRRGAGGRRVGADPSPSPGGRDGSLVS
jgi:hypothetical protein